MRYMLSEHVSLEVIVIFDVGLGLLEGLYVGENYIVDLMMVISWRRIFGITFPWTWW